MRLNFIIIICFGFITAYQAQTSTTKVTPESAETKFKHGNYEDAIDDYLILLDTEPKNELYNYNLGVCYLNSDLNKSKAIPYFEIVTRLAQHNPNADYLLGRAYQYALRFDDAISSFNKFKQQKSGSDFNLQDAEHQIQHCFNAKELMKYPINVTFQNLGANINSTFNDYYPFVPNNESFILYNTNRPEKNAEKLDNGAFANSIYKSQVINGKYSKGTLIGSPINKGNTGEEIIGMNSDGTIILLYILDDMGKGELYMSKLDAKGNYSKPELLDEAINSDADEIAACVTNDGNTIYFASNQKGGYGGIDLYACRRLPSGEWSDPQNLGPEINTPQDEDFPNISPDGKTLYFSSKGHTSMGGYDIFKATYNNEKNAFMNIQNIGYPINSVYDDMNFRVSKNGKYGYISSIKAGGKGGHDIYRVKFNDEENEYSIILGKLTTLSNIPLEYKDVFINIQDDATNELVGNYVPNVNTGRFIIILPPGKYKMTIEAPNYELYNQDVEVFDKGSFQAEINMLVELKK